MSKILVTEIEQELPKPGEASRERLEREIAVTDITYEPATDTGTLDMWGVSAAYSWDIDPDSEVTCVREQLSLNRLGLVGLLSWAPATTVLSALLVLIATDAIQPFYMILGPNDNLQFIAWPAYLILGMIAGLVLCPLVGFRVAYLPTPAKELSNASTNERMESLLIGIGYLATAVAGLLLIGALPLFVNPELASLGYLVSLVGGIFLLSSALTLALTGIYWFDRWELLRCEPPDQLLDIDDKNLTTRYRIVEARFDATKESVVLSRIEEAAASVNINIDPSIESPAHHRWIGGGQLDKYGFDGRYEWEIERQDGDGSTTGGDFLVRERLYVFHDYWVVILSTSAITAALVAVAKLAGGLFGALLLVPLAATALFCVISFVFPSLLYPRGIDITDPACTVHRQSEPAVWIGIIIIVLSAIGILWPSGASDIIPLFTVIALLGLGIIATVQYEWLFDNMPDGRVQPWLPHPTLHYLLQIFTLGVPVFTVFAARVSGGPIDRVFAGLVAMFALFSVWVAVRSLRSNRNDAVARYETLSTEVSSGSIRRWGSYVLSVFASIGIVGGTLLATKTVYSALGEDPMGIRLALSVPLVAILLVPLGGVAYQIITKMLTLLVLLRSSRSVDPTEYGLPPDLINADVRIYDGPVGGGRAVSLGGPGVVFFSTGDADVLDPSELAAMLTHEDAHASVFNDGTLSVLAPLIAGSTLTGQNVLLGTLNFRRRELRADEYAAMKTSPTQLIDALDRVSAELAKNRATGEIQQSSGPSRSMSAFASFTPDESELSIFDKTFGLFYGGFTLTLAHPDVETRQRQLRTMETHGQDSPSPE